MIRLVGVAMLSVVLAGCTSRSIDRQAARSTVANAAAAGLFQQVWRDERNDAVTLSAWRGTPLLLTMFYRKCRARCPTTIHKLRRVEQAFREHGRSVAFALVTLNPDEDTPDRLAAFAIDQNLSPKSWHLLSGGMAETRELARFLSVHAAYDDAHIDHDVKIAVFDAEGRLVLKLEGWTFDDDEPLRATALD